MRIAPEESPQRTLPHNLILFTVCIGIFFAALDQTVIYGAMADMMQDLHLPVTKLDQAAWIVTGYLLGYTFAMPLNVVEDDVDAHSCVLGRTALRPTLAYRGDPSVEIGTDVTQLVDCVP